MLSTKERREKQAGRIKLLHKVLQLETGYRIAGINI